MAATPENTIWSAAYVGDLAAVKAFIEAEGQGPDIKDPLQGSTPLHWAAFGGHLGLVRWLVKEAGSDPNALNNDGCTPLFFACEMCHTGVVQWLVREGGAAVNVRDGIYQQTPLHRVCFKGQQEKDIYSEELLLWLVTEGRADLFAVDRFGHKVEGLGQPQPPNADGTPAAPPSPTSASVSARVAIVVEAARRGEDLTRLYLSVKRPTGALVQDDENVGDAPPAGSERAFFGGDLSDEGSGAPDSPLQVASPDSAAAESAAAALGVDGSSGGSDGSAGTEVAAQRRASRERRMSRTSSNPSIYGMDAAQLAASSAAAAAQQNSSTSASPPRRGSNSTSSGVAAAGRSLSNSPEPGAGGAGGESTLNGSRRGSRSGTRKWDPSKSSSSLFGVTHTDLADANNSAVTGATASSSGTSPGTSTAPGGGLPRVGSTSNVAALRSNFMSNSSSGASAGHRVNGSISSGSGSTGTSGLNGSSRGRRTSSGYTQKTEEEAAAATAAASAAISQREEEERIARLEARKREAAEAMHPADTAAGAVDAIRTLVERKNAGLLSEDEFQKAKAETLEMVRLQQLAASGHSAGASAEGGGAVVSVNSQTPPCSPKAAVTSTAATATAADDGSSAAAPAAKPPKRGFNDDLDDLTTQTSGSIVTSTTTAAAVAGGSALPGASADIAGSKQQEELNKSVIATAAAPTASGTAAAGTEDGSKKASDGGCKCTIS